MDLMGYQDNMKEQLEFEGYLFRPFYFSLNKVIDKFMDEVLIFDQLWINFHTKGSSLRDILLVVLTKRSQLFIFRKQYQKFCKTYQCSKVYGTKYATNFFL